MNRITTATKLKPTATFEGSLYQLYFFQDQFQITKKQKELIKLSMKSRNSIFFDEIKCLSRAKGTGNYESFNILKAIRKNQAALAQLKDGKEALKKPRKVRTRDSKENIISDLNRCQLSFDLAFHWLKYEQRSIRITTAQRKIIHEARKRDKKIYKRLKQISLAEKKTTCTPMNILECIRKNTDELRALLDGKSKTNFTSSKTSIQKTTTKSLPLDTTYKYPTKTSKSIWTVQKR